MDNKCRTKLRCSSQSNSTARTRSMQCIIMHVSPWPVTIAPFWPHAMHNNACITLTGNHRTFLTPVPLNFLFKSSTPGQFFTNSPPQAKIWRKLCRFWIKLVVKYYTLTSFKVCTISFERPEASPWTFTVTVQLSAFHYLTASQWNAFWN